MDPRLETLENEFLRRHFEFHPGAALYAGVHDHDHRLEDFSPEAILGFCSAIEALGTRVRGLDRLGPDDALERDVLIARIEWVLADYRLLKSHERDPFVHAETLSGQLNTIAIFDYASLEERLEAVIAKEREAPRLLETARRVLGPTPPILREYGVRGLAGARSLIERDLPLAFAAVASPSLQAEAASARGAALAAIDRFLAWLKEEHPAGAEDGYRLGREVFTGYLAASEQISESPEALDRWALGEIEAARAEIAAEAARIDRGASPAEVVARVGADHPPTGRVVVEAAGIAEAVYAWMRNKDVCTFPSDARVRIADTPEFMRWSFGSMWTPGPFERPGVQATYYATDADPSWPPQRQEEHLTAFSRRGLENLAIHEAYPGHFIQALHQNAVPSPVRRSSWWGVFGEGWAHYCEQMVLEEGFGGGAPEARIVQLQEALSRLCRFVHCIRLHCREDWGFADGTRFFMEQAWQTEAVARAECERAAFDPFYLRYTLGKKAILELRAECRSTLGPRFDLKRFHDAMLDSGNAPMPLMRRLTLRALGIA